VKREKIYSSKRVIKFQNVDERKKLSSVLPYMSNNGKFGGEEKLKSLRKSSAFLPHAIDPIPILTERYLIKLLNYGIFSRIFSPTFPQIRVGRFLIHEK
jgi:hypothetical protein